MRADTPIAEPAERERLFGLNLLSFGHPMRDQSLRDAELDGELPLRHVSLIEEFVDHHAPNITEGRPSKSIPLVFVAELGTHYLSDVGKPALSKEQAADAERLRAIWNRRKDEWKVTQEVFADRLGMSQGFFNHLLRGRKPMNYEHLTALASHLKVKPEDISPSVAARLKSLSAGVPIIEPPAVPEPDRARELRSRLGKVSEADRMALLHALIAEIAPGGNVSSLDRRRAKTDRKGKPPVKRRGRG